ncbi:MAG: hypothetical protein H0X04_00065 [Chthoniobacterales bacterium]|nr:hypothetical protein [Chthoniobacterales bacterium]
MFTSQPGRDVLARLFQDANNCDAIMRWAITKRVYSGAGTPTIASDRPGDFYSGSSTLDGPVITLTADSAFATGMVEITGTIDNRDYAVAEALVLQVKDPTYVSGASGSVINGSLIEIQDITP